MELFAGTKDYIRSRYFMWRERLSPSKIDDAHDIPIIVNNFNRLTMLLDLLSSLEKRGYNNIIILDNGSTYPPLLEYYDKSCPYEIIRLENLGFKALWRAKEVRKRFCGDYYIYTDSDVVFDDECPDDVVCRMFDLLKNKYKTAFKIGPAIRIDNLPDCYEHKAKVIACESCYFDDKRDDGLYRAPIDTTFALYRPRIGLSRRSSLESYRMAAPYTIRHQPWYEDSQNPNEEELYYKLHCRHITVWSSK